MGMPHLFHKKQEKHKTKIKPWPHNPYSKQFKLVINITVSQTPKPKKCHPLCHHHYHLLHISISIDLELSDPRFLYGPGETSSFSSGVLLLQILYVQNPPIPIKIIMAPPATRYPIAATTLVFFFPSPSRTLKYPTLLSSPTDTNVWIG
jgi:hypothetical protein